jgi:hypothetical protein
LSNKKWRLKQDYFDKNNLPETFPVFLKPEWGQNSNGIIKINNKGGIPKRIDQII